MTTATQTREPLAAEASRPAPATVLPPAFLKRITSPIGRIELASDGHAITALAIEKDGHLPFEEVDESTTDVLELAATQLGEYFAGDRHEFEVPVALNGTPFQRAVWSQLQELRFGEVSSYGAIGLATGRPAAGRAVGGAIGANPVPIIVGCHRVLASNNKITGYSAGAGIPTKVWLLDHEGIGHA